jgi:hypothetical protein
MAPTISSSAWIWGIIREIGEGPITHLTMLVTPKSMNKVRRSSNALSRKSRAKVSLSTLLSMKAGVTPALAGAVELKAFLSCQDSGAFHCILVELYGAALRWASWAAMDSIPSSTCFAAPSK